MAFLLRVAFAEVARLYTPEALAAMLFDTEAIRGRIQKGTPVWIALLGKEPVGTLSAFDRPEGLHVRSMAVHPGARGQGVGRALLAAAEGFGRERGHTRMFLRTTPFLHAAIALYYCKNGNTAAGIPVLEKKLLESGFTLPEKPTQ